MTRPKHYKKSLKQLLKENKPEPTDTQMLFYKSMVLPKLNIKELLKIKKQLAQMKKCTRCKNLLSVHDKRYSYCVLIRKKMIQQHNLRGVKE